MYYITGTQTERVWCPSLSILVVVECNYKHLIIMPLLIFIAHSLSHSLSCTAKAELLLLWEVGDKQVGEEKKETSVKSLHAECAANSHSKVSRFNCLYPSEAATLAMTSCCFCCCCFWLGVAAALQRSHDKV